MVDHLLDRQEEDFFDSTFDIQHQDILGEMKKNSQIFRGRRIPPLFFFVLFLWMLPVYKYQKTGNLDYYPKARKKVLNISLFILVMSWVFPLGEWFFKITAIRSFMGPGFHKGYLIFTASLLLQGSLLTFFNLNFTIKYATQQLSAEFFKGERAYEPKSGFSINLTQRITIYLLTLGLIPILLNMAVFPISSLWLIQKYWEVQDYVGIAGLVTPYLVSLIVNLYFLVSILLALGSFKRTIQRPINKLIDRMNQVSKGDFTVRTRVFTNDEIGKLKGRFNQMTEGLEEREKIRDTFGKFVSMEIAQKLMAEGEIDLEGEEIETTVMFTDIRGFTSFSENYSPKELVEFLNQYFSYITEPIHQYRGVVNKFIGDSVMAIFSPIFGVENHAEAAVQAALGIRQALKEFNAQSNYPAIRHGIGIHTGLLIAGNVGASNRKEYTVIGDTVNVASRIESQTKIMDKDILLSQDTYQLIPQGKFSPGVFEEQETVTIRGKRDKVKLFSIL